LRHLAAVALLLATAGVSAAGEQGMSVLARTGYAVVAGRPEAQPLAGRVAALVEAAVLMIAPVVGTGDLRPVQTVIYLDRGEFAKATGISPRSRIVGLATFPAAVIHIDGTELLADVERVVPHEVGHIMIARALGPALPSAPVWLCEGIAEYAAGERASQVDPVALRAIGRGSSLHLDELDGAFRVGGGEAGLAYAEAASVVNFLVAERGEPVIAELLSSLAKTGDPEASLRELTGWTNADLETAWRRSVSQRWRWPLLFDSPALIYGLMVFLFAAGLARYLRDRRRRRQEMDGRDW